ncbi:MAG: glycoside hydrolase [Linnemannia elongata]|nr:MAG: glycoside hydrolase [Linnemannia elongata]
MHNAEARADRNKDRSVAVKKMIRHAWFGFVPAMVKRTEDIKTKSQQLQVQGEWIDIMDTLLLAGMSDEYELAKTKVQELTGPRRLSNPALLGSDPWRSDDQGQLEVEQQELETALDEIREDDGDGGNDSKDRGIRFFDSVVRQLGGLLSIYELERSRLSKDPEILKAAVELGDQLALAFQGPNNALPASTIFESGRVGLNKVLAGKVSLAEVSTFQLEFRQLSHLTSNDKYRELAENNFKYLASLNPKIPGLYPAYFYPKDGVAPEYVASFGSLSDGFYEYLLKTYILTGDEKFKDLYISSIEAMHKHLISHSQKSSEPHLVLGVYDTATDSLVPKMDHLSCFAPGLLAIGAKALNRPKDLTAARGLMKTCFMSYQNSATGLGADEIAFLRPEFSKGREFEMLPKGAGFYLIDPEYALRPETVESLFILYRITGEGKYQEYAWEIAQAIEKHCRTKDGYSGLINVMDASEGLTNTMPSHFLSQTLKYLYLILDNPDIASLDDYIFNTEGHLIKYPFP